MSHHILYEATPWHTRCSLFDDKGRLLTLRYDDTSRRHIEGAVAYGRIRQVVPSLGSAFVDIGDTYDALLPLNTLPPGTGKLTQGQPILVRISRGGFAEKGARLDARTAHKPPAADTPCPSILQNPPSALTRALHDAGANPVTVWLLNAHHRESIALQVPERSIRQLDVDGEDSFPGHEPLTERLDNTLDAMLSELPTFPFRTASAQGNLIIELTSAVATVDINAGPSLGMDKENATLAVNLAAAEEVARLSRLLDLGGSVIVDFITPRSKSQRDLIAQHLASTFQTSDEHFVENRPMSRHGLLELTRERSGPSLMLLLKTPAYIAGRIGLELWRTPAGANPRLRNQTVIAHPHVIHILQQQLNQTMCLTHLGRPVQLQADGALPVTSYRING